MREVAGQNYEMLLVNWEKKETRTYSNNQQLIKIISESTALLNPYPKSFSKKSLRFAF